MDLKNLAYPLKVAKKIQETADAQSFVLEIPAGLKEKFKYKAGQFVTFFMNINGEDVRRSYSLASSPEMDSEMKVTVKRVAGGLGSNYLLDKVKEGDTLNTTPPAGLFVIPKDVKSEKFVFFAAGSGITPIISLIKTALCTNEKNQCHLLYANRDENSIIFHRELKTLNEKFHQRFRYEYILSQPKKPFAGMTGRLHGPQVKKFVENTGSGKDTYFFLCGPEGFMSTIESALEVSGVDRHHIIKESFFVTPKLGNPPAAECAPSEAAASAGDSEYLKDLEGSVLIGDRSKAEKPSELRVELDGEVIEIAAKEGQSVLETLLEAGYNPPYSCMDGACMACMGKVQEGLVYQEDMGILTEDNTEIGECLTCQAKPASKKVSVSYEL